MHYDPKGLKKHEKGPKSDHFWAKKEGETPSFWSLFNDLMPLYPILIDFRCKKEGVSPSFWSLFGS